MFCSKCGAENPNNSVFCNQCGVKIQQYSTSFQQPGTMHHGQQRKRTMVIFAIALAIVIMGAAMMFILTKQATDVEQVESQSTEEIEIINK